jgi:hypothetical protein
MKNKSNELVDLMIKKNQECEKLKDALKAILQNTIHRDFNGDIVYKSGVLTNIKIALGEEDYNYYVELYT